MSAKPTASSSTSRSRKARQPATDLTQDTPAQAMPVVSAKAARGTAKPAAKLAAKPARSRSARVSQDAAPVGADIPASAQGAPRRGRPSKVATSKASSEPAKTPAAKVSSVQPKDARTRTRKAAEPVIDAPDSTTDTVQKRGRGRPRKAITTESPLEPTIVPAADIQPKAVKSRTRKAAASVIEAPKPASVDAPKRGRPRKATITEAPLEPAITPAADIQPKAVKSRTRKAAASVIEAPKPASVDAPKRGRPRKVAGATPQTLPAAVELTPSEDARSSITQVTEPEAETTPKRGRGRPRKVVTTTAIVPALDGQAAKTTPPADIAPEKPRRSRRDAATETQQNALVVDEASAVEVPAPVEAIQHEEPQGSLFAELGLSEPIMAAIRELGYLRPTPIQAGAIPKVLSGRDVLGVAQTGTGKTASFVLPLLEMLAGSRARARMPRSLILEPTRELALQVAENFKLYGKHLRLTHALLIGGESMKDQREILDRGVDVLIATPGRLIDLFERGGLLLTQTRHLVIDEADRMLDMGFIPDIEKIVGLLPFNRQTLFFSATMAPEIRKLADAFLSNPEEITVARQSSVATTIEESLVIVPEEDKRRTLRKLLRQLDVQSAIVFSNRKRDVDMLLKSLTKHGFSAGALHGDLPQSMRFATLERFRAGELSILVCSDVAARGIDIGGLGHVFNFDLPFNAEDYVHRIGRTGRAGKKGHAISLAGPYDKHLADAIETLTGRAIPQPAYAGVTPVEWAPEDEARDRGGRHRDKKRHGKDRHRPSDAPKPREHSEMEVTTQAVDLPKPPRREPVRRDAPKPQERRPSVVTEAQFDHTTPQTGFGHDTPAFMLLPRRARQKQGD